MRNSFLLYTKKQRNLLTMLRV